MVSFGDLLLSYHGRVRRHVKPRRTACSRSLRSSTIWTGKKSSFKHAWDVSTERQIERRESAVFITILSDTLFESDSDSIKPATCPEIDIVADVVNKYPQTDIVVDAHTDCIRSEEENLALSELQAWILKKALVARGVASSRVKARGWGEAKPVASNATEAGRHANRRVTIKLAPDQS